MGCLHVVCHMLVVFKGRVLTAGILPNIKVDSVRLWLTEKSSRDSHPIDAWFRGAHFPKMFTDSLGAWDEHLFHRLPTWRISVAVHAPVIHQFNRNIVDTRFRKRFPNVSFIWTQSASQWQRMLYVMHFTEFTTPYDRILFTRLDIVPQMPIWVPDELSGSIMFPFWHGDMLCDTLIMVPRDTFKPFAQVMERIQWSRDYMIGHTQLASMLRARGVGVKTWLSESYTCGTGSMSTVDNPLYHMSGRDTSSTIFRTFVACISIAASLGLLIRAAVRSCCY